MLLEYMYVYLRLFSRIMVFLMKITKIISIANNTRKMYAEKRTSFWESTRHYYYDVLNVVLPANLFLLSKFFHLPTNRKTSLVISASYTNSTTYNH